MTPNLPEEFVITRTFNAPLKKVWAAFSEIEHLKQWWGPQEIQIPTATLDFQPEGFFHYQMKSAAGDVMWGKFRYQEIVPSQKIAFINSFSDAAGNIIRPPFSDAAGNIIRPPFSEDWPLEILNTITFEEREGKTTIVLRAHPVNAAKQETETFAANHESMRQGYGGTWDKLEIHLSSLFS